MSSVIFPAGRLGRIADRHGTHFWHAPRHRLLLGLIDESIEPGARILDVGCGTGALVTALSMRGYCAEGIDPWASVAGSTPDFPGPPDSVLHEGQAESLPFPEASFDAVCAFDVLEHVDDVASLAEFRRILRPRGKLLVSVPAHRWLWSNRDTLAGHRRRYSRADLVRTVEQSGFKIDRVFGFQCVLLPVIAAARMAARLRPESDTLHEDSPPAAVNALLRMCNQAEVSLGRWLRPPTGSSLVLRACLPDAPASQAMP